MVQVIVCVEKRTWFVELDESLSGNISLSDDSKILVNDKGNTLVH